MKIRWRKNREDSERRDAEEMQYLPMLASCEKYAYVIVSTLAVAIAVTFYQILLKAWGEMIMHLRNKPNNPNPNLNP